MCGESRKQEAVELDSEEDAQASGVGLCGLGRMQFFERIFNRDKQQQLQRESSPTSSVTPTGCTSGGEFRSGPGNLALPENTHFISESGRSSEHL